MPKRPRTSLSGWLNGIRKATWKGDGATTRVSIELTAKLPRKLRRAMRNRRWEKKFCKAVSEMAGIPLVGVARRV